LALTPGTRLGVYEVTSQIGAGGMGEVYRATDSNLKRLVAIKVLPASVAGDADRLARFQREAEVLAALNHPNIAAIYGLEKTVDFTALVMELVEGEDLSQRIARGAIPLDEALPIPKQIAEALEAAHEQGIVHRDLKPANIKVRSDGAVKVLDFGLAKAMDPPFSSSAAAALANSPTITSPARMTAAGIILGTAAYMSPEQARGKVVDKRTDIWAFGCVLYEILTGHRVFGGDTTPDTLGAILEREPDWTKLPAATPPHIRRLLQRCLEKDAKSRLRDIGDARIELEETLSTSQASPTPTSPGWRSSSWFVLVIAGLSAVIATIAVWNLKPARATAPQVEAHFMLPMPAGVGLALGSQDSLTVSPDGRHVAFLGRRGALTQLYLRTLQDADETKAVLPETEGANQTFISPDSQWLAFFAGGKLKKVPTSGGVPVVICDAPSSRGGFWGENGTVVFSPQARGSGIFEVSAGGGAAKQITTLDTSRGETSHRFPELLPGDETVLFVAYGATYQDVSIVAQSLKTGQRRVLIEGGSLPHYASTGHLLYVQPKRPGTIMAVAFDPEGARLTGTPVSVVEGVLTDRGDYAHWSLARSGMLVYASGGFKEAENNLVLVDRKRRRDAPRDSSATALRLPSALAGWPPGRGHSEWDPVHLVDI
jgi:serine/threonine protein kinase